MTFQPLELVSVTVAKGVAQFVTRRATAPAATTVEDVAWLAHAMVTDEEPALAPLYAVMPIRIRPAVRNVNDPLVPVGVNEMEGVVSAP